MGTDELIRFRGAGFNESLPSDARDMEGIPIPSGVLDAGGYAIAKHMGPWANGGLLSTGTLAMDEGELCQPDGAGTPNDNLRQIFINDAVVQADLNGRPELHCDGMMTPGGAGGFNNDNCATTVTMEIDPSTGTLEVISWVINVTNCHSGTVTVERRWSQFEAYVVNPDGKDPVIGFTVPGDKDPKLVPVPKTELEPGLYEFTITLEDGSILHRYEDFSSPVVINAVFASFSTINIYPVPVKDSFAADFNLVVPMDINMTVVNNEGHTYYQEDLHFPLAGRNKEVVKMDQQWPSGLYHAIFQYADGSSESLNFTVAE